MELIAGFLSLQYKIVESQQSLRVALFQARRNLMLDLAVESLACVRPHDVERIIHKRDQFQQGNSRQRFYSLASSYISTQSHVVPKPQHPPD